MTRTQDFFHSDLVKTRKDKDRYKPLFCESKFYTQNIQNFKYISELLLNARNLTEQQKVVLWTICLCLCRRPLNWYGGSHKDCGRLSSSSNSIDQLLISNNDTNFSFFEMSQICQIEWPQKINKHISTLDFINTVKIKPLPEVAHLAFVNIYTHIYPIKILSYEPTPLELLKLQSQGIRIITFQSDYSNWASTFYGQRDPLSFWLHDCIHAEHFFSHPEHLQMQIGFYRFVCNAINAKTLETSNSSDSFRKAFDYLISDMNTHPLHLLKTFKAILDIHFNQHSSDMWMKMILANTNNQQHIEALRNINTAYFRSDDCDISLHLLKGLGAQG